MDPSPKKILRINPQHPEPEVIRAAAEALGRGSLVIVPTETVYGLAADPDLPGAVRRIFSAKGRPDDKPIPLLAPGVSAIERHGAKMNATARRLADAFWPGPLTLVLANGENWFGYRVPDYPVTKALLVRVGRLLAVTSANRSGEPAVANCADALASLDSWVGLALDAGPSPGGVPSTVVKVNGEQIEILRQGVIPEADIRRKTEDGRRENRI